MSIKIGDLVRLIPYTYIDLSKFGFLQNHSWDIADIDSGGLKLGAQYTIIDKRGRIFKQYKLKDLDYWIYCKHLILQDNIDICPFRIGDVVCFKPKCSLKDLKFLQIANPTLHTNQTYKITRIINDYYIIINSPYPENWKKCVKNEEIVNESIPLRWIDFKKVNIV